MCRRADKPHGKAILSHTQVAWKQKPQLQDHKKTRHGWCLPLLLQGFAVQVCLAASDELHLFNMLPCHAGLAHLPLMRFACMHRPLVCATVSCTRFLCTTHSIAMLCTACYICFQIKFVVKPSASSMGKHMQVRRKCAQVADCKSCDELLPAFVAQRGQNSWCCCPCPVTDYD